MPRKHHLIVDGYNVIRNNERYAGLGPDYDTKDAWNKARQALINDAALVASGTYSSCTVVFDGAGNPNSTGKPKRVAGITVIFSPTGVTADSIIERLAHDAREQGDEATVVSSDLTIQSTVFGGGVTRMSATGFASHGAVLEEEWQEGNVTHQAKNTVAERIDPEVAAKLAAMVRAHK